MKFRHSHPNNRQGREIITDKQKKITALINKEESKMSGLPSVIINMIINNI